MPTGHYEMREGAGPAAFLYAGRKAATVECDLPSHITLPIDTRQDLTLAKYAIARLGDSFAD